MSPIHRTGQTMAVKFKAILLGLLAAQGATSVQADYGIVRLDGAGHGTLITARPLDGKDTVYFQFPLKAGRSACCKRLESSEFKPVSADSVVATNELTGEAPNVYEFRLPRLWSEQPFVGIAANGHKIRAKGRAGGLTVLDARGQTSSARTCTSLEGVHLIERQRQAERTHLYLSLGYDIETPTCR